MEKERAIQDIGYIKELMNETRQIMDFGWPIYVYWGLYFLVLSLAFANTPSGIIQATLYADRWPTLGDLLALAIILGMWIGFLFTAVYVFWRRKELINPKLIIIGTLALAFVIIYLVMYAGMQIVWGGASDTDPHLHIAVLYTMLMNGIYFGTVFMILGLIYSREQLWLGFIILFATLLSLWLMTTGAKGVIANPGKVLLWGSIGLAFMISGIWAYQRQKKQTSNVKTGG